LQFISTIPPLYKYPEDGSLLMPEIPDIHDDESVTVIPTSSYPGKRSASTAELDDEDKNEKRSCH
jgi:hypothetical protein